MSKILKHVYIVRHGETLGNKAGVREDHTAVLSQEGRAQAKLLAQRFTDIPVDVILSSPYIRARQTAGYIARATGLPLEAAESAFERDLPETVLGRHRRDPETLRAMAQFEYSWINESRLDEGETFAEMLDRAKQLTQQIEERPERNIVVVSHGFFGKFFTAYHLLGDYLTPDIFVQRMYKATRFSNTGIMYFRVLTDNKWQLYTWNDHAHLGAFTGDVLPPDQLE